MRGTDQRRLLGRRQLIPVVQHRAVQTAAAPRHMPGIVFVEYRPPLVVRIPRQRPVRTRLAENYRVAGLGVDLHYKLLVLLPFTHLLWAR